MSKESLIESWQKGLASLQEQLPVLQEKEAAAHAAVDAAVNEAKAARVARAALQTRINIARQNLERLGVEPTSDVQDMPQGNAMTAISSLKARDQLDNGGMVFSESHLIVRNDELSDPVEDYTGLTQEVLREMQSLNNEPSDNAPLVKRES
jgi:hypothetical protein